MEAESDVSTSQATPRATTRSWEGGLELTLPQSRQREPTLPTARFYTAGLQNLETMNSWYSKPPSLWHSLTAARGNQHIPPKLKVLLRKTAGLGSTCSTQGWGTRLGL